MIPVSLRLPPDSFVITANLNNVLSAPCLLRAKLSNQQGDHGEAIIVGWKTNGDPLFLLADGTIGIPFGWTVTDIEYPES